MSQLLTWCQKDSAQNFVSLEIWLMCFLSFEIEIDALELWWILVCHWLIHDLNLDLTGLSHIVCSDLFLGHLYMYKCM